MEPCSPPARSRFISPTTRAALVPSLTGFCGSSPCSSGEHGSGVVPGGTRAPVRDAGTRAHAGVWLGQRRRLPGDLDLPPARNPGKGEGWGLSFTYGSSSSSSFSGLMPDPGVQLMLWDFPARALPHQPAGVGDLGQHPPFLPCGPWEPPRQRSSLRGRTCGRGDRVTATLRGLEGRDLGRRRDTDTGAWRQGDVEGWGRGGTGRWEHTGVGTQGDRVGEHAQGVVQAWHCPRKGHSRPGWDAQGT